MSGMQLPKNLEKRGYENIAKITYSQDLANIIKSKTGIEIAADDSVYDLEHEDDEGTRLPKQYLWYHLKETEDCDLIA